MSTFTWLPSYTSALDEEPRVNRAVFGGGYTQRAQDGINALLKKWNLRFVDKPIDEGNAIRAFLRAAGGVHNFDWTDPEGYAAKFVCAKWSTSFDNFGAISIVATFEEVPE